MRIPRYSTRQGSRSRRIRPRPYERNSRLQGLGSRDGYGRSARRGNQFLERPVRAFRGGSTLGSDIGAEDVKSKEDADDFDHVEVFEVRTTYVGAMEGLNESNVVSRWIPPRDGGVAPQRKLHDRINEAQLANLSAGSMIHLADFVTAWYEGHNDHRGYLLDLVESILAPAGRQSEPPNNRSRRDSCSLEEFKKLTKSLPIGGLSLSCAARVLPKFQHMYDSIYFRIIEVDCMRRHLPHEGGVRSVSVVFGMPHQPYEFNWLVGEEFQWDLNHGLITPRGFVVNVEMSRMIFPIAVTESLVAAKDFTKDFCHIILTGQTKKQAKYRLVIDVRFAPPKQR